MTPDISSNSSPAAHRSSEGFWGQLLGTPLAWGTLLFFLGGLAILRAPYHDFSAYFLLTMLAVLSCLLLLSRMRGPLSVTFPFWVLFLLLVAGYFLKFYWLTASLATGNTEGLSEYLLPVADSYTTMFHAFQVSTLALVAFCVFASFRLGQPWTAAVAAVHEDRVASVAERLRAEHLMRSVLIFLVIFTVITAALQYVTGIAVAGGKTVVLPFRMAGVIYYSRAALLPVLLLVMIWLTEEFQFVSFWRLSMMLLVVHGVLQTLLTTSRGALVGIVLPPFLLWTLTGRLTRARRNTLLAAFLFVVSLYPVITAYRYLRITGDNVSVGVIYRQLRDQQIPVSETARVGFQAVVRRIGGVDGLLYAVHAGERLPSIANIRYYLYNPERPFAAIFTQDVVGMGQTVFSNMESPTLLGALFLLGGTIGVVAGIVAWTYIWSWLWAWVSLLRLRCDPVARTLFLALLMGATSEGTLDTLPLQISAMAVSIAIAEILLRRWIYTDVHREANRQPQPPAP